jgi:hypothetical protein
MSDCQEMIKLWLSLETNHGLSVVLCNMSLGLSIDVQHRDNRRLWRRSSKVVSCRYRVDVVVEARRRYLDGENEASQQWQHFVPCMYAAVQSLACQSAISPSFGLGH